MNERELSRYARIRLNGRWHTFERQTGNIVTKTGRWWTPTGRVLVHVFDRELRRRVLVMR